mmetsp:Transcript_3624/g.12868  ORF Transcript_3624/g.12868 Transcript_3624/m.12868 type:complete len:184 (-) Transcript_3624:717-1268(-)
MEQAKTLQLEKKLNAIRHLENKFSDSKQQQVKPAQQALAPSHDKKDRHQEKEEKQGEEKQVRKSQRKEEAEGQEQVKEQAASDGSSTTQLAENNQHKIKHKAQHATAAKSHPLTRFERLVQWAEAHGLPKKLADNPADKDKVRRIIARMKADEVVEQMKHKFSHYEKMVSNVVKTAEDDSAMN